MIDKLIWSFIYKTIARWERKAYRLRNKKIMWDCVGIQNKLIYLKSCMIEEGIWK